MDDKLFSIIESGNKLFLDTNVLLDDLEYFSSAGIPFIVSSTSLIELEAIKTSKNKTDDIRAAARRTISWMADNPSIYEVVNVNSGVNELILNAGIDTCLPDAQICACAKWYSSTYNVDVIFITHDLSCRNIASNVFGLTTKWFNNNEEPKYTGFKEVVMSDSEMAYFYEHQKDNIYELLTNQYIIIKNNTDNAIVDTYRWDGAFYQTLYKKPLKSLYFEKLKPKDIYQSCVIDSIMNNTITAITGRAGSGKSLISLVSIMTLIESGKYDRFVTLFNPIKARNTADLGYYAGEFLSKAMLNSVGNILTTKFGDRYAVDLLLTQNRLKLVSMADCRGMEIMDNELLYIPEAANTTIDTMKLCLSRVSSGAKVIIEGDPESQVDSYLYENKNNGLLRAINQFKGHKEFGYIQLQNVWRSKIAELCELL